MIVDPPSYITGNIMCLDRVSTQIGLPSLYQAIKIRGLSDIISGSAQPQIVGSAIKEVQLDFPCPSQNQIFNIKGINILDIISRNNEQNKLLISIRDTLLPKLMSGELDVSNIDI